MSKLEVFDPAMCCSTGVCGPSVDGQLVRLAADLAFLKSRGVEVARYNLARDTAAFTSRNEVLAEMGGLAEHLPLFLVDGVVVAKGRYPDRAELGQWCGVEVPATGPGSGIVLRQVTDTESGS